MNALTERALDIAASQVGVREVGRNRGPRVEEYLASVGLPPGNSWCAAFVHWCFQRAADELMLPPPLPKTGGVHKLWRRIDVGFKVPRPTVGSLFFHDSGGGLGHVGFVAGVRGDEIDTIEGNTDDGGSREGDGVMRRVRRRHYVNLGFVDLAEDIVPRVA